MPCHVAHPHVNPSLPAPAEPLPSSSPFKAQFSFPEARPRTWMVPGAAVTRNLNGMGQRWSRSPWDNNVEDMQPTSINIPWESSNLDIVSREKQHRRGGDLQKHPEFIKRLTTWPWLLHLVLVASSQKVWFSDESFQLLMGNCRPFNLYFNQFLEFVMNLCNL